MAELPSANVTIDDEAGALAGGVDYITIFAAVAQSPDAKPRVFGSTKSLLAQHGYAPGVDYAALHFEETGKPVIFIGLPIVTQGAVGRIDNSHMGASTSAISVAAGASGALEETDGIVTVLQGGVVGTDQIILGLSLDGGLSSKTVRIGTATSYVIPYVGLTLNLSAGSLVAGAYYTWASTAPRWDQAGLAAARAALAKQQKQARSWLIVGDLTATIDATNILTEVNGYETANNRFVFARAQLRDRLPLAALSKLTWQMTGTPTLTFVNVGASGDTITRSSGSWIADGFAVGDVVTVTGSVSNNVTGQIASLTATVITFGALPALTNEGPTAGCHVVGTAGLTFTNVGASGDTITRSSGSWLDDGFRVGDTVTISGTVSNNVSGPIAALTPTVMTFGTTPLATEVIGASVASVAAGETEPAFVAAMDGLFAPIDAQRRIDLGLGRARKQSLITSWSLRRPVQWAASLREYQHDVQIPTYRKADGPLDGWSLLDADGSTVEFDQTIDGGALEARFTCFRSYENGPLGAFIALSLTRAIEDSLLSRTHNMAVANVFCSVIQAETENQIGAVLELKDDGTGTEASLQAIEEKVNTQLAIALLQARKEGKRASAARWRASRTDILDVPGAELTGVGDLRINGTIEKIRTRARVQTGG